MAEEETPAEAEETEEEAADAGPDVPTAYGVPVTESRGQQTLHPSAEELHATVEALQAEGYDQLMDVIGVDYLTHGARELPVEPQRFEVVYLLLNHAKRERMTVRVQCSEDEPTVPTLFDHFPGAETPEREAYDMLGITFEGHPDLCRILMPEDWVGHPLRKDYAVGSIPVQFKGAPARR